MPIAPTPPQFRFAGRLLRSKREQLGLTREELATRCRRSVSSITALELDYHPPNLDKVASVAAALGVPIDALLERVDTVDDDDVDDLEVAQ